MNSGAHRQDSELTSFAKEIYSGPAVTNTPQELVFPKERTESILDSAFHTTLMKRKNVEGGGFRIPSSKGKRVVSTVDVPKTQIRNIEYKDTNYYPLPEYADLARLDNELELFSNYPATIKYVGINTGPGWFDLYLQTKLSMQCLGYLFGFDDQRVNFIEVPGYLYDSDRIRVEQGRDISDYEIFRDHCSRSLYKVDLSVCKSKTLEFLKENIISSLTLLIEGGTLVLEVPGDSGIQEASLLFWCCSAFKSSVVLKPVSCKSTLVYYLVCRDFVSSLGKTALVEIHGNLKITRAFASTYEDITRENVENYEKFWRDYEKNKLPAVRSSSLWATCQILK